MNKIQINLEEAVRVFKLMEEINAFFHQRENYNDVYKFGDEYYGEIREVYYDVIWNWFPSAIQKEIMEE